MFRNWVQHMGVNRAVKWVGDEMGASTGDRH